MKCQRLLSASARYQYSNVTRHTRPPADTDIDVITGVIQDLTSDPDNTHEHRGLETLVSVKSFTKLRKQQQRQNSQMVAYHHKGGRLILNSFWNLSYILEEFTHEVLKVSSISK